MRSSNFSWKGRSSLMTKPKENNIEETLEKIKETVASVKYGTVTLVIQDGHVVQIEKNEKIRLK